MIRQCHNLTDLHGAPGGGRGVRVEGDGGGWSDCDVVSALASSRRQAGLSLCGRLGGVFHEKNRSNVKAGKQPKQLDARMHQCWMR